MRGEVLKNIYNQKMIENSSKKIYLTYFVFALMEKVYFIHDLKKI